MKKLLALLLFVPLLAFAGVSIVRGNFTWVYGAAVTLTPAQVAANTTAEQTFTVSGVKTGDAVMAIKPTAQAGLGIGNVRVSAANTIAITFENVTITPITPTSEAWTILIFRPEDTPLPSAITQ